MQKTNFGSNEEFIANYKKLKSSRKMGELYNCSKTAVLNHAKAINFDVKTVQKYKLSEKDKKEILAAYNQKTSTELAEKYNVSRGMITNLWYKNNLSGKETIIKKTSEIDMTGQKIGKWTVLYKTEKRNAGGVIYWH